MTSSIRAVAIAFVLLGVAVCTTAWAQPGPGGPPGGGGGFGMGGPGFGGPGMGGATTGGPWMLLSQASVAKELNLTSDQKSQIKKINEKSQAATRDLFDSMQDASQEERQEIGKKLQSVTQESNKALAGALSEDQVKRLKGIFLQFRGEQALRDPEIQDALGLTDDQKAKIRSPLAVLTDEQKTALENMKGAKFDISSLRMGFGRGGFGGGGPGGQGGGPGGPGGNGPRTRPPAARSE